MNVQKRRWGLLIITPMWKESAKDKAVFPPVCARFFGGRRYLCVGELLNSVAKGFHSARRGAGGNVYVYVSDISGALFTGLGVYDVLGRFAGAGSIVPITGFANSIVAPAVDFKQEGYILGVGAKMFHCRAGAGVWNCVVVCGGRRLLDHYNAGRWISMGTNRCSKCGGEGGCLWITMWIRWTNG